MKTSLWAGCCVVFFLTSCSKYFNVSGENDFSKLEENKSVDVLYVKTELPDTFFFSNKFPGKLENDKVSGIRQVLLQFLNPDSIIFEKSVDPYKIRYAIKDGILYSVFVENNRNYAYNSQQVMQVPFTDIRQMYVRINRPYVSNMFLVTVLGVSAIFSYVILSGIGAIGNDY